MGDRWWLWRLPATAPVTGREPRAPHAGPDGLVYLAYRLRKPLSMGRGYANVVARSKDGESFEEVVVLNKADFDCDSLERPALVALPDGGWRLYVSCATPDSKHWRVDALDARSPEELTAARRRTVLAGSAEEGLKDPVVVFDGDSWHMWVCAHPLDQPGEEDRMTTRYATSLDGISWRLCGTALAPRAGTWDARGTRVAHVLLDEHGFFAYYDGRASADDNAEELTGTAVGAEPEHLVADGGPISGDAVGSGSLRYLTLLPERDGHRLYYETTRRDGAHDLRTEYVPPPLSPSQS